MSIITITTIEPLSTGASAQHRTTLRDIGMHPHAHAGAHTHAHAHMYTHPCIHALRGHCGALPCAGRRTCGGLPRERSEKSQSTRSAHRVLSHRTCGVLRCEYSVSTPSTHRALGVLTEYRMGTTGVDHGRVQAQFQRARGQGSGSQEQHQPLLTSRNTKHHTSARQRYSYREQS
jgi:hypothetical protein